MSGSRLNLPVPYRALRLQRPLIEVSVVSRFVYLYTAPLGAWRNKK